MIGIEALVSLWQFLSSLVDFSVVICVHLPIHYLPLSPIVNLISCSFTSFLLYSHQDGGLAVHCFHLFELLCAIFLCILYEPFLD